MSFLLIDDGPAPVLGRKVLIATTAYDSPDARYTFSMARTREAMHRANLPTGYLILSGNCHVDDARNAVVREFLDRPEYSELVFIDADVVWDADSLIKLCEFDRDIVGGVYPFRRDEARDTMPVRQLYGKIDPDELGLLEVEGLPTGFLRIRRRVLEDMAGKAETCERKGQTMPLIFGRDVYKGLRRGGDIGFCMKARALGYKIYAAAELRLGHVGKMVIYDSLAASLRRQIGTTFRHICGKIREGTATIDDFAELWHGVDNKWAAEPDALQVAAGLARASKGPIIEAGSGLTTLVMAAATDQRVFALEHAKSWAWDLVDKARAAGLSNISPVVNPLKNDWYDIDGDLADGDLPEAFGLGVVDGPPRLLSDRMRFFEKFGAACEVILVDDADDAGYAKKLRAWADDRGRKIEFGDGRIAVIHK